MAVIDWAESLIFHLFDTGKLDEDEGKEGTQEKEPNDECVNKTPREDGVMPKEENQSNVGLIIGE